MSIESGQIGFNTRVIHPLAASDKDASAKQVKRDGKRQARDRYRDEEHPVTNAQGEITGKVIDVTA